MPHYLYHVRIEVPHDLDDGGVIEIGDTFTMIVAVKVGKMPSVASSTSGQKRPVHPRTVRWRRKN